MSQTRSMGAILLIAIGAWVCATPAFAQGGTADISGTVFDPQKAVLPGVTVSLVNEATGQERTTVTEVDGRFTIPTVLPGTYTVRAELQGFQTTTQQGLVVAVGQEVTLDLTLRLAGVQESVTVTAEAPLVEATASRIGVNITSQDIDNLPAFNRSQFSLMQTIPGMVPSLQPGSFEGGQYSANGQATTSNMFLVDGQFNNDSRLGGAQGTQARISLDSMAEYQVQTHQYGAEYGGSTGVVVNTVSRSGTNNVFGRVFEYYKGNALQATDYFLKQAGEENPDSSSHVFGGHLGGPIVQNRLFYFGNIEYTHAKEAANLNFPADAAPLAVSYSNYTKFTGPNTYLRFDYQASTNHRLRFSWLREAILTQNDELEGDLAILDASRHENDSGDVVLNFTLTSVLGNRATNEIRLGRVEESLRQGPRVVFDDNWNFIGFGALDPLTLGPQNSHPDYIAGNRNTYAQRDVRDFTIDDSLTYVTAGGAHTLKVGFNFMRNPLEPSGVATNFVGNYMFPTNAPFDLNNPRTYPWRLNVAMGQVDFDIVDYRASGYISDKWTVGRNLTLNLGLRYDWQDAVPDTKDAFGPRFGFAYNVGGADRTVVRGGVGKVYQYQQLAVLDNLARGAVIAPTITYDTAQVASPATTGLLPTGSTPEATTCLRPALGSKAGVAVISPACRGFLEGLRNQVLVGSFVNTTTTGPLVDGDRRMAYTWNFSIGVKRELMRDTAMSADYVGNRGYDNAWAVDINEGPVNPATGRITRLGVNTFDPNSELVTGTARTAAFAGFYQYQTLDALNSDFDSLELGLEKRYSNRWAGRVSYTLGRCRDAFPFTTPFEPQSATRGFADDRDPRRDYGACARDNRHAFASSANAQLWRGLGAGIVFRAYSGYPINETIGSDANGDGINVDRPVRGIHDATRPIVSKLDAQGMAVRNGIDGPNKVILDARAQYIWDVQQRFQAGVFLEVYNVTNHVNYGPPTGSRLSRNFLVPIVADDPTTAQIGFRLTF